MKVMALVVAAATTVSAGCAPPMAALHAFAVDGNAAFDPALGGSWTSGNDEPILIRMDGAGYRITFFEKNRSTTFRARLLRIGNAEILDMTCEPPSGFMLSAHLPVRIWIEGDTLRFALLDTAWIKDLVRRELAWEEEAGLVITAPGDQVARFLEAYGGDERAYEHVDTLERVR